MSTRLPALGLEDTAARILAACAAREPQVDPWDARGDRCAAALSDIAAAMMYADFREMALTAVRSAASEARAWRLSLPEDQRGNLIVLANRPASARMALHQAIRFLIEADRSGGLACGNFIRYVEAFLRAAGESLLASGAE